VVDVGNFRGIEDIDPFKDAKSFTKFFHNYLKAFGGGVKLEPISVDTSDAGKILDDLREAGRKGDKYFLVAWLEVYCAELRKKDRTKNRKHTSIKAFGKTLSTFKQEFYDPKG